MFNGAMRNIFSWIGIFLILMVIFNGFAQSNKNQVNINYSTFVKKIKNKEIVSIKVRDRDIEGRGADNTVYRTYGVYDFIFLQMIKDYDVEIRIEPLTTTYTVVGNIILSLLPTLLFGAMLFFLMRGKGGGFSLDMSNNKMISKSFSKESFADIGGLHEPKKELREIVDFFKNAGKYKLIGAEVPKGLLLVGDPGNGKTLLVRALAGESNVPFFIAHGSSFIEVFAGMGAKRVRSLFEEAKKNAPCIIFIDEIDAIGGKRSNAGGMSHSEGVQTLNEILTSMDGFESNERIIVIGATNRVDVLDSALLRAGRFDRKVYVHNPSFKERVEIANVYLNKVQSDKNVTANQVAQLTVGMPAASVKLMVNEAAIFAVRDRREFINLMDLDRANDKLRIGMPSSLELQDKRLLVAYHEAGHALLTVLCKSSDPIHKATITPMGHAAGFVSRVPLKDKMMNTYDELLSNIIIACGGRAAEEMMFGRSYITIGAGGDIEQATTVARAMITEYGMSDKVGFVNVGLKNQGYSVGRDISAKTFENIDTEVKNLMDKCYKLAMNKLLEYKKELHDITQALLTKDIVLGDEISEICKNIRPVDAYEMLFNKKNKVSDAVPNAILAIIDK
ncbi:MAG: ATP-dependent metallopeptidase FtsH/Yme1/Tma family protein [Pseudomonadota bacterium]